jgi:hypothetical protein
VIDLWVYRLQENRSNLRRVVEQYKGVKCCKVFIHPIVVFDDDVGEETRSMILGELDRLRTEKKGDRR